MATDAALRRWGSGENRRPAPGDSVNVEQQMEARCSYLGWTNDGLRQCTAAAVPGLARCEAHLSERTGRSIKYRRATTRTYEGKLRITVPLIRFVRAGGLAWVDDLR